MFFPPVSPTQVPELAPVQKVLSCDFFWAALSQYRASKFTGSLSVRLRTGRTWSLYLHAGDVIWIDDDLHPHRRWFRHWQRHCPKTKMPSLAPHSSAALSWSYQCLVLSLLDRSLELPQVLALINGIATDALFDLTQAIAIALLDTTESEPVLIHAHPNIRPSNTGKLPKVATLAIDALWQRTQNTWKQWVEAGLTQCPLYLAPQIVDPVTLKQHFPAPVYAHILYWLDGERTLRDLAGELEISPLNLMHSLKPYLHAGVIRLHLVADWGLPPQSAELLAAS
jgi:hypothetical protein